MNVFVLGTGRCGTSTFYQACKPIRNYTCGHETQAGSITVPRFEPNHIEVSSGLTPLMGRLEQDYDEAVWIHLVRERSSCARSLSHECRESVQHFSEIWFHNNHSSDMQAAELLYDCINPLIAGFLKHQKHNLTIRLETVQETWPQFWGMIGAEGDYRKSLDVWTRRYNSGVRRGRDNFVT